MGKFTVLLAVIVGFLLGLAAGLTRAPMFTVYEFEPESVSTPEAVAIPASIVYYDGHHWIVTQENVGRPADLRPKQGWCSDGMIWPARSDGSCWMADAPR